MEEPDVEKRWGRRCVCVCCAGGGGRLRGSRHRTTLAMDGSDVETDGIGGMGVVGGVGR